MDVHGNIVSKVIVMDVIVMDVHENIVSKVTLAHEVAITELQWNCERFNMEERDDTTNPFVDNRFIIFIVIIPKYHHLDYHSPHPHHPQVPQPSVLPGSLLQQRRH